MGQAKKNSYKKERTKKNHIDLSLLISIGDLLISVASMAPTVVVLLLLLLLLATSTLLAISKCHADFQTNTGGGQRT